MWCEVASAGVTSPTSAHPLLARRTVGIDPQELAGLLWGQCWAAAWLGGSELGGVCVCMCVCVYRPSRY